MKFLIELWIWRCQLRCAVNLLPCSPPSDDAGQVLNNDSALSPGYIATCEDMLPHQSRLQNVLPHQFRLRSTATHPVPPSIRSRNWSCNVQHREVRGYMLFMMEGKVNFLMGQTDPGVRMIERIDSEVRQHGDQKRHHT